jgi:hypothetical protein
VSTRGPNAAPAAFCAEPEAQGIPKAHLQQAMKRLLDTKRVRSETYRRGGHDSVRLVPGVSR